MAISERHHVLLDRARENQSAFRRRHGALSRLRRAIIDNTQGDLFWIGEILLAELEKETGFKGQGDTN